MAQDPAPLSDQPSGAADSRVAEIRTLLAQLDPEAGALQLAPGGSGDGLAQILAGLGQLAKESAARRAAARQHLEEILEVMLSMLALDFSKRAPMKGVDEGGLDALAFGLNNISDELASSMVSRAYVDNILDSMLDPLLVLDAQLSVQRANQAAIQLFEHARSEWQRLPLGTLLGSQEVTPLLARLLSDEQPLTNCELRCQSQSGRALDVAASASLMRDGAAVKVVCVFRDLTERKRVDAVLQQSLRQEQTIAAQRAVIAELSIPLIPISDQILVMPLIGAVDAQRAQRVLQTLLDGIVARRAAVVILDITGVGEVDAQVAGALLQAGRAVKLLGARFILTGIRTEVAQTLIRLGIDLSALLTHSTLQSGIAFAMAQSVRST